MSFKLLSVVLLLQIVTAVLVFTITRAYYLDQAPSNPDALPARTVRADDMSTDELIRGLQKYTQQGLSANPGEINQQANEAFQRRDFVRAAALYQRLVELSPDDASAYNNLGLTLHYLGRSKDALEILKLGSELQPDFQRIWLTLGFVRSGVGQHEAARQAFERAVALGPETDPIRASPPDRCCKNCLNLREYDLRAALKAQRQPEIEQYAQRYVGLTLELGQYDILQLYDPSGRLVYSSHPQFSSPLSSWMVNAAVEHNSIQQGLVKLPDGRPCGVVTFPIRSRRKLIGLGLFAKQVAPVIARWAELSGQGVGISDTEGRTHLAVDLPNPNRWMRLLNTRLMIL